jgi:hypothetical protein
MENLGGSLWKKRFLQGTYPQYVHNIFNKYFSSVPQTYEKVTWQELAGRPHGLNLASYPIVEWSQRSVDSKKLWKVANKFDIDRKVMPGKHKDLIALPSSKGDIQKEFKYHKLELTYPYLFPFCRLGTTYLTADVDAISFVM